MSSQLLSLVAIQPLMILGRVVFALVVVPLLTWAWLRRLLGRIMTSALQEDVLTGSGGVMLSGRFENAVFVEGVGT